MLSNFMRRGGKRKVNKVNEPRSHQKSFSASPPPEPVVVLNINEESSALARQNSLQVELNLSNLNEEWFPQELLQARGPTRPLSRTVQPDTTVTRDTLTELTSAKPSPSLEPSPDHSGTALPSPVSRKKSIPAPIFIPEIHLMPHTQKGRAAKNVTPQIPPNNASFSPPSPSVSDSLSAVSGTTLARALMASSFFLPPSEYRNSRRRSGVARQDSATLPHRESFFLSDSGITFPVPPVPPMPPSLVNESLSPNHPKSGSSTESEYPVSDSYIASPEMASTATIQRRITRTQRIPSPTSASPSSSVPAVPLQRKLLGSARPRAFKHTTFDVPKTAFPMTSQETSQYSSQEGSFLLTSDDHSLDEFEFLPPEPQVLVASPESDSSASRIRPLPKVGAVSRARRKCSVNELKLVKEDPKEVADGILASCQSYVPLPSTTGSDYGELLNYDLTVSPGTSSSGYQTFPETPKVFSPLWSPEYAMLSRSDSQVLRKFPPTPRSAKLAQGRAYSSVKTARRQLSINEGIADSVVVLRRCRSSLSPIQRTPSPKQTELNLPPSGLVGTEADSSGEVMEESTIVPAELQNSGECPSILRPHPLSHVSSSSSCLPEEEGLRALARHSALSLPSIIVDDDKSFKPTTVSPHTKSSISVPLPESTGPSPFSSPALPDNVPAALSSTSPPSSLPSTTTTNSQSHPSCPLSVSYSSLEGSSFLPSPSPASSRSLSPMPPIPSTAVSDELAVHSPSPSFVPPPPYHTVVSDRTTHNLGANPTPPLSRTPSVEPSLHHSRQDSSSSLASFRSRVRARPPLPIGPRKQSVPGQMMDPFAPCARGRNGPIFSLASADTTGAQGPLWRKLKCAFAKPPPKFHRPPPKWRGLTMEAATWTFTSQELQELVSRAIQQSSEGSSLRLFKLDVLEGEIADEVHRLELQHTDVKAQYKALVRKRRTLMGALACHIEGRDTHDGAMASRAMEELAEVLLSLDQLAEQMHSITLQLAQLKSLRDVHNASALALVVRKINGLLVRQMAVNERLQEQVDALETERDEAWKHAEDIAQDYDTLNDRMSGSMSTRGDARSSADSQSLAGTGSKRSTRISAVRKSSLRQSQAGLRPRSRHRSSRLSSGGMRPASLSLADIPPLPRLPSIESASLSIPTGISCGLYSSSPAASEALALAEAQREVYEMLGLSVPPSQASSRRRTMSAGPPESSSDHSSHGTARPPSSQISFAASSRPVSASFTTAGTGSGSGNKNGDTGNATRRGALTREEWRRAIYSVVLEDASFKHRLPVSPLRVAHHR